MPDAEARRPHTAPPVRPRVLRPVLGPAIVDRPRLRVALDTPRLRAVTFVVAPSGYGKSALVAGWLAGCGGAQAWLSLDREDDSAGNLARAIVAACQREAPGVGRVALAMLPAMPSPEAVGAAIAGELAAAGDRFTLVLDDAQELVGDESRGVVRGLIAHAGPGLHVVMTSWVAPQLDREALLKAGRLVEITASDLAFRADEILAVAERCGDPVGAGERLDRIVALSAGWPVIVRLLLAGGDAGRPIDAVLHDPAMADTVAEYVRRLTAGSPPEVIAALAWATLVDPVCDDLLAALLPPGSGDRARLALDLLGDLVAAPVGGDGGWVRLLPIVREELAGQLPSLATPAEVREARLRAAAWLFAHRLVPDAVKQALAAGEIDLAASYVVTAGFELSRVAISGEVARWAGMIPPEVVERRADLLMLRALDYTRGQSPIAAAATLAHARAVLATDAGRRSTAIPVARLLPMIDAFAFDSAPEATDSEEIRAHYRRTMPGIAAEDQMTRGAFGTSVAFRLALRAGVDAGLALLDEWERGIDATHQAERVYHRCGVAVLQDFKSRDGREVRRTLEDARRLAVEQGIPGLHVFTATRLGWEELRALRVDAADRLFAEAASVSEISGFLAWRDEIEGAAMVRLLQGDESGANAFAAGLVASIERAGLVELLENARSFQARLWLAERDFARVDEWLSTAQADPLEEPPILAEMKQVTWIRAMLSVRETMPDPSGIDTDIAAGIDKLEEFANLIQHERAMASATLCKAVHARVKQQDFRVALAAVVRHAARRDDLLLFAEYGLPMAEALSEARDALPERAFVERAITAATGFDALFPHRPVTRRPSERELEVLRALTGRLDRHEIARQMFISDRTVQRHTITLYRKLGVSNRADAVHRGIELGWLPQP